MRALPTLLALLLTSCTETRIVYGTGDDPDAAAHGSSTEDYVYLLSDNPCTDPCTFRTSTNQAVRRVRYEADGWVIGESSDRGNGWPISYDFQVQGDRLIKAYALDEAGRQLGAAGAWIEVVGGDEDATGATGGGFPDVPYFYQYANSYSPGSSCQNTSAAMVLAWLGWSGDPDDLTAYWGTQYAQTPAGLAAMFNAEAGWGGIGDRLQAHTSGSIDGMKRLLDAGLPVIIHGYFTSYGHVVVVLGYDSGGYWVNDPAGTWNERFMGGYPYGWEPTAGHAIYYEAGAFEAAVATSNGSTYLPLWYHELY